MSPALAAYRTATSMLEPLAPALLRRRATRGKEDRARLGERLGRASRARPPGELAWLHGASVGETLSLLPLVARLQAARPALNLLVTSGTLTSARLLAERLPAGVVHQFTPLDTPAIAGRFLDHWRPDLAVFVESELWPNLILGAQTRGATPALVSARLSDASLRAWARAPAAAEQVLGAFDLVLAQDDAAASALVRLGARDDGRLNLKLAGDPLPVDRDAWREAARAARGRPVLLAASTHPGEEALALDAFAALPRASPEPVLIVAPRHPERGAEVADLCRARGWASARRGAGEPWEDARVYVADTLGELGLWFRLARAAYVGGGASPGVGGHNPLEPARLGCPLASGLRVENWRAVYAALADAGGGVLVPDAAALTAFWRGALDRDPALQTQAERARALAKAQSGELAAATARLLGLMEASPRLPASGGASA